jgi:uncharacterized membrane protein YdcZ (DUF606 family)
MFAMEFWIGTRRTFLRLCTAFAQPLLQRFFEVSVGIIVALAVVALCQNNDGFHPIAPRTRASVTITSGVTRYHWLGGGLVLTGAIILVLK